MMMNTLITITKNAYYLPLKPTQSEETIFLFYLSFSIKYMRYSKHKIPHVRSQSLPSFLLTSMFTMHHRFRFQHARESKYSHSNIPRSPMTNDTRRNQEELRRRPWDWPRRRIENVTFPAKFKQVGVWRILSGKNFMEKIQ